MATTAAVHKQFPHRKLVACFELHTFSSLNKTFLEEYHGAMATADDAWVYFSPKTVAHKKLPPVDPSEVERAFGGGIRVITDADTLFADLRKRDWNDSNLLLMSSGTFSGQDVVGFAKSLVEG